MTPRYGVALGGFGLFALGLLAGGGTRQDVVHDLIVQGAAVALLAISLPGLVHVGRQQLALVALLMVALALPLIQCIPLPTVLWQWAPGRSELLAAEAQLGLPAAAWRAWSLDPTASLASARALLPALAMAVIAVQLRPSDFRVLAAIMLAVALLSVPLGLAQVAQGPHSDLRLYRPTNIHEAVGLFANRNHCAALLAVCATVVLGAMGGAWLSPRAAGIRTRWMIVVGLALLLAVLWFAIAQARSRGGMLLLMVAMLAMLLMVYRRTEGRRWAFVGMLLALALAGSVVFRHGFIGFADRLAQVGDQRLEVLPAVLAVGGTYGWLGTGAGSFPAVYAMHEPDDLVGDRVLNHAHNDWAELAVEFGLLAVPVLLAFLYWLWRCRASPVVRDGGPMAARRSHARFDWPRAVAWTVVGQLILHSVFDYPLRTTALSLVFVVALAYLALPTETRREVSLGDPMRHRTLGSRGAS